MKKIFGLLFIMLFSLCIIGCDEEDKDLVKVIDIELTEEEYAYAIKKANSTLKDDFNSFLNEIKTNGKFDEIVAKYFEGKGTKQGVVVSTGGVTNNDENFVVATNCPFEPFEYLGSDGLAYGIDIEIAYEYAKAKNLELVIKNISFDTILNEIEAGNADIGMAGMTIREDRLEVCDFTDTYYKASQKIVVAYDNTDFDNCKTAADVEAVLSKLENKKIGYQNGTTGNWYVIGDEGWGFAGFANIKATGYSTAQLAIQDIINGSLYAVVIDDSPAAAMVRAVNGN